METYRGNGYHWQIPVRDSNFSFVFVIQSLYVMLLALQGLLIHDICIQYAYATHRQTKSSRNHMIHTGQTHCFAAWTKLSLRKVEFTPFLWKHIVLYYQNFRVLPKTFRTSSAE